jgi:isopentenyl diphosphate isomerase/L-lactate dehydrogenase-like FMN-dependent dehydrogenase/nitrite reductase/ring-hydroxylating ferredoxin subunit
MRKTKIATWSSLHDRSPTYALVAEVDLVVIRWDDSVSVLYGRCLHRGALLSDGHIEGSNLLCGLHGWDYRYDTGVSEYNNHEVLQRFQAWIDLEADAVLVDEEEIRAWAVDHPQPFRRDEYLGLYADVHGAPEEPLNAHIQELARDGLGKVGHHGPISAMGVPRQALPSWDDLQILTGQLARPPLLDDEPVTTGLTLGARADKPLQLEIPILVSDMSFGALSEEAKVSMARGAEMAGTGICSGEGGMLPEEQAANSRYIYELASGRFGWSLDKVRRCSAFHFKAGQGAKTGTGGHLPGNKVTQKIAEVRGLQAGESAISPARFADLVVAEDFRRVADEVREATGGIPIGFKMSAQHIEDDIDFALEAGADYIIIDGRGGGTGAAPELFKNHISVPTLAAIPRARLRLDERGAEGVTLIATGGLRTAPDFIKAMSLGADGVAIANSALQAIGCLGMRACNTNNCPVGIATQKPELRQRLQIAKSAQRLHNFLSATTKLMQVMARACGHRSLAEFSIHDLCTWKRDVAYLSGVSYAGAVPIFEE